MAAGRASTRFLRQGMQTFAGHCSGRASLVRMMIVPLLLTLGAAGMASLPPSSM